MYHETCMTQKVDPVAICKPKKFVNLIALLEFVCNLCSIKSFAPSAIVVNLLSLASAHLNFALEHVDVMKIVCRFY